MSSPLLWHIGTVTDGAVTVGAISTVALAFNGHRVNAVFVNDSDQVIYISRGNAAVIGDGIRLNPNGGSYEIDDTNLWRGAVNAICALGDANLCVSEGVDT